MPLIDVEMVMPEGQDPPRDLARRVADALGEVFGTPAGRTWVRLRILPETRYAENGRSSEATPTPVFVRVWKAALPGAGGLREEALGLAEAVAEACDRPLENVHVIFAPPTSGRIAFGGRLYEPATAEGASSEEGS